MDSPYIHHIFTIYDGDSPPSHWIRPAGGLSADRLGQQRHAGAREAGDGGTRVARLESVVDSVFPGNGKREMVDIWVWVSTYSHPFLVG